MKKIILYAYGEFNLGDDLFIKVLLERYPYTQFIFYAHEEYKKALKRYKNIKVINKDNFFVTFAKKIIPNIHSRRINRIEKNVDGMVYIGGSIFIEYPNWKDNIEWYKNKSKKFPVFIIGANFGPYTQKGYVEGFRNIYPMLADVCFRDRYSYNLFKECNTVRMAPDVIFSLKGETKKVSNKQIFISVIDCESRNKNNIPLDLMDKYDNDYIFKLSEVVEKFIDDGYDIILSSFCEKENDLKCIKKICNKIDIKKRNNIKVISYTGYNLDEILDSINESEYIIASRFHASILGFIFNKPVFPIIYSLKTENMLKDLDFTGNYIKISKINTIDYKYIRNNLDKKIVLDINKISADAEKQFLELDKFLNETN